MSINDLTWKVIADIGGIGNVTVEDISNFKEFLINGIKGSTNVFGANIYDSTFKARQTTLTFYNGNDLSIFNVTVIDNNTLSVNAFNNISEVVIRAR